MWHQECFRSDRWFLADGFVSSRVTNGLRRGQALLQEPSPTFPPKAALSFLQGNGRLCLNLAVWEQPPFPWDLRATLETWDFCFPCFSHGCGCGHLCLWGTMGYWLVRTCRAIEIGHEGVSLAELFEKKWGKRPVLSEKERKSTFALINSAHFDDKDGGYLPQSRKIPPFFIWGLLCQLSLDSQEACAGPSAYSISECRWSLTDTGSTYSLSTSQ